MMHVVVREAGAMDVHAVSAVLIEAASWLEEHGVPLWNVHEVSVEALLADVASGLFVLAEVNGTAAGTLKYQLHDSLFWPDICDGVRRIKKRNLTAVAVAQRRCATS